MSKSAVGYFKTKKMITTYIEGAGLSGRTTKKNFFAASIRRFLSHNIPGDSLYSSSTVCSGSSDPFYIASLLYKLGHYFLEILYVCWCSLNIGLRALVYVETTKLRIQLFIIYAEESSLGSLALSDSDDLYVRM